MILKKLVFIGLISVICGTSFSEFRIWRDLKGNSIEAEFVCENSGKIVIRDRKGKSFKFEAEKLSIADQKYLKTAIPPDVEITFKKNQDRRNHDWGYSAQVHMNGFIEIKKTSRMPYDSELKAILMMIGEDQGSKELVMLDKAESTFYYKNNKKIFELEGQQFQMYDSKYNANYGVEYTGFLALVLDKNDNLVGIKSSRKEFEAEYRKLLKFNTGNRFSRKFTSKKSSKTYY